MVLFVEGCYCKIQGKSILWEVQYFYLFYDYTPVINFNNAASWDKYPNVSNKHSEEIIKTIAEIDDMNVL